MPLLKKHYSELPKNRLVKTISDFLEWYPKSPLHRLLNLTLRDFNNEMREYNRQFYKPLPKKPARSKAEQKEYIRKYNREYQRTRRATERLKNEDRL